MKRSLTTILLIPFFYFTAFSQSLERQVLGPAGNVSAKEGVSVSWSAGEPVTETFASSGILLNQGFQQGASDAQTSVDEDQASEDFFQVYPNPGSSHIWIDWNGVQTGKFQITVTDLSGRQLINLTAHNPQKTRISTGTLAAGTYILRIRTPEESHTVKFLKK